MPEVGDFLEAKNPNRKGKGITVLAVLPGVFLASYERMNGTLQIGTDRWYQPYELAGRYKGLEDN